MKLCQCGHAGDPRKACACSEGEITKYRRKLSGPLSDRIDMNVTLTPVPIASLGELKAGESSYAIRSRVERTRDLQRHRYAASRGHAVNAIAPRRVLWPNLERNAKATVASAADTLGLSARGFDRVLRVARTIADLSQSERIRESHVAEALRYRPR